MYTIENVLQANKNIMLLYSLWETMRLPEERDNKIIEQVLYGKETKLELPIEYFWEGTLNYKGKVGTRLVPGFWIKDKLWFDAIRERKQIMLKNLIENIPDTSRSVSYTEKENMRQQNGK